MNTKTTKKATNTVKTVKKEALKDMKPKNKPVVQAKITPKELEFNQLKAKLSTNPPKAAEETKTDTSSPFDSVNKYDFPMNIKEGCRFCNIYQNKKYKILYQDELCFAFLDKAKKSSKQHILMCPITHIKNAHSVKEDQIYILEAIQKAGENLLKKLYPGDQYRFGYHEPPVNSVDHLHLHCLVLPITKVYIDKIVYGSLLSPTSVVIQKIKDKGQVVKVVVEAEENIKEELNPKL